MSRSIALTLLLLAGVACLAPALSAEDQSPAVFIAPEESVPVSAEGGKVAPEKQAGTAAAEKAVDSAKKAAPAPAEEKAADRKAEAPVEAPVADEQKPNQEDATPAAADKAERLDKAEGAEGKDKSEKAERTDKAAKAVKTEEAGKEKRDREERKDKKDKKADAAQAAPAAPKDIPLPPIPENEQKLHALVKGAVGADAKAARASLKNKTPREISAAQAALKGIERNLGILRQAIQEDISRAALQEAKAVFDPVITISFSHTMQQQNNRYVEVKTYQKATVKTPLGYDANGNPLTDENGNIIYLDVLDQGSQAIPKFPLKRLVFNMPRIQGFPVKRSPASVENPNGPVQVEKPSLRIDQQLPWGPSVFITLASQRQETYFDDGPDASIDQRIQALNQILADQNVSEAEKAAARAQQVILQKAFKRSVLHFMGTSRPWTSYLQLGGYIPVPCTRDWGEYARADVGVKLAKLDKERAFWDTKTVINSTLRDVDWTYWGLVGALENLRAVSENRKLLEVLQSDIQKLLDAGRTTAYGKLQIDGQVAGVKEQEAAAWAAYVQASNALVNLLDLEENLLLLPAGYTKNLGEQLSLNTGEAFTVALENRPDLKAQRISGKVSEVLVQSARHGVKPDLRAAADVKFSQNTQPFGYKTWSQSLQSLLFDSGSRTRHWVNLPIPGVYKPSSEAQLRTMRKAEDTSGPDVRTVTGSLSYSWPFLNRAVKADLRSVELSRDMQDLSIQMTENVVEEDIGDAIVGVLSTKAQYDMAQEQYRLAESQYKLAAELMAGGRMTEFEMITRSADLLSADLGRIAAATAYKKAESELLRAEGVLPNTYAAMRAQSALEGERLESLAASKALRFFEPMAVGPGEAAPDLPKPQDATAPQAGD